MKSIFNDITARRIGLMLVVTLLTMSGARALTVTMTPENGGTYRVKNGKLYVTANQGFYVREVWAIGIPNPLVEEGDANGAFFYVEDSWEVTIYFEAHTDDVHVTFNMNGHGGTAPAAQDLKLGDKVTCPTPDPTDEGFVFCGWATDTRGWKPYDFDAELGNNLPYNIPKKYYTLRLYAVWTEAGKEYQVKYYDSNGLFANLVTIDTIAGGSRYTIRGDDALKDLNQLYDVVGWATEVEGSAVLDPWQPIYVTEGLNLYAITEMLDAEYGFKPHDIWLTGAGYNDITFTMHTLVLGKTFSPFNGNYVQADGIFIKMSSGYLSGDDGATIPFKVTDAEHSAPDETISFYIKERDENFTAAIYIDPEDIKTAPPGLYTITLPHEAIWSPSGEDGDIDGIILWLNLSKRGDVNGDDEVNVSDVTALVNIILGNTNKYDITAVDVNVDGEVNVSDVTALVNIILGQTRSK